MGRRYTYTANLEFSAGGECGPDHDVTVSFLVSDGMIEDITLEKVDGKSRPWGMHGGYIANEDDRFAEEVEDILECSDHHAEAMLQEAAESDAEHADRLAEARTEAWQ